MTQANTQRRNVIVDRKNPWNKSVCLQLDTVHSWLLEKRQVAEFKQSPASRQHFDIWEFQMADGESITQPTVGEWIKEKRQVAEFLDPPTAVSTSTEHLAGIAAPQVRILLVPRNCRGLWWCY
jgi:hypothetical protein